jgi:hypothetical protein
MSGHHTLGLQRSGARILARPHPKLAPVQRWTSRVIPMDLDQERHRDRDYGSSERSAGQFRRKPRVRNSRPLFGGNEPMKSAETRKISPAQTKTRNWSRPSLT